MTEESSAPRRKRGEVIRKHGHPDRMPDVRAAPRKGRNPSKASIERDAEAMRLRSEGWTLAQIDTHLSYGGVSNVSRAIDRWVSRTVTEPAAAVRERLLQQLDAATNVAMVALRAEVPLLHQGEPIVTVHPVTGQQVWLRDLRPNLAAVDRIERLTERVAKLTGAYDPEETGPSGGNDAVTAVAELLREAQTYNQQLVDRLVTRSKESP